MDCVNLQWGDTVQRNLLITLRYDGKNYHGWQIQKNALSVQEKFQNALYKVLGETVDIKGCSRTDSGVHAYMYCVSVKTYSQIPCIRFPLAINKFLPNDIVVTNCKEVQSDFHARYSCTGKEYVYKILNQQIRDPFLDGYVYHYWYNLDENLLNNAAKAFIGTHDFTSFCTLDNRQIGDFVRTVKKFTVKRKNNIIEMKVSADGFLYNMVRIMVGTLLLVQIGKISQNDIAGIIKAKNRKMAGPRAPSCGLYLNQVYYENF